jgi:hypothetical protein
MPYSAAFLSDQDEFSNQIQGNLGEFFALCIGREYDFSDMQLLKPANAITPLSRISQPGVDILWILFADDPSDDCAYVQEVKTTTGKSLAYADALRDDYEKLYGADPRFSLAFRLVAAKLELELVHRRPDLAKRVTALMATSPATSSRTQLLPTLIHEGGVDPVVKLLAVRTTIAGLGWSMDQIEPHAFGFEDLGSRLVRLAMGKL